MIFFDNLHFCTPVLKLGLLACSDHPGPQARGWIHQKHNYATTTVFLPFPKGFVLALAARTSNIAIFVGYHLAHQILFELDFTSLLATSPRIATSKNWRRFRTNVPKTCDCNPAPLANAHDGRPSCPHFCNVLMLTSRQWSLGNSNAAFEFFIF